MRRTGIALALALALGGAGWGVAQVVRDREAATPAEERAAPNARQPGAPAQRGEAPREAAPSRNETPMAERVATLGLLNKRNGIARDVILRPGQSVRVGDVIVRLRACEATADWEHEKLTGAFVQVDVRGVDGKWRRPFSGWLYKESPSLNVVEHPIYDVWPKSCAMHHPDIGVDTVAADVPSEAKRSSAKKSAGEKTPAAEAPSAASSNAT